MKKALFVTYLSDFSCDAGDKIYSTNILTELKKHYELDVLSYSDNLGFTASMGGVRKSWMSVFSFFPSSIYIYKTRGAKQVFYDYVREFDYDVIIFDHLRTAWLIKFLDVPEKAIYLSHNVEYICRAEGFALESNYFKKAALYFDYLKTKYWELKILKEFTLCSAISEVDQRFFSDRGLESRLLKPGYSGEKLEVKDFHQLENTVAWVGSFKYFAKRINLINFCEAVKRSSHIEVGFKLLVVGLMDDVFAKEIRAKFSFCEVFPNVDSVTPYLNKAKCGIIFEPVGGGFKLKALDYAFSRTPIVALSGSCEGVGFRNSVHFVEADDVNTMVNKVRELLSDNVKLKIMSDQAFDHCCGRFNWEEQVGRFIHG
jgi:glycosyltransferase involved in cell wall biosynthesis